MIITNVLQDSQVICMYVMDEQAHENNFLTRPGVLIIEKGPHLKAAVLQGCSSSADKQTNIKSSHQKLQPFQDTVQ